VDIIGAWVVAASSVAIPTSPNKIAISSEPGSQNPHIRPRNIPMDNPTNNVGVKTPPGAPDPLLASTARILHAKIPPISENSGGESKNDCTTL